MRFNPPQVAGAKTLRGVALLLCASVSLAMGCDNHKVRTINQGIEDVQKHSNEVYEAAKPRQFSRDP